MQSTDASCVRAVIKNEQSLGHEDALSIIVVPAAQTDTWHNLSIGKVAGEEVVICSDIFVANCIFLRL